MMPQDFCVSEKDIASSPALGQAEPSGWMPPSEALNQLQPVGGVFAQAETQGARGRYGFRIGSLGLLVPPRTLSEVIAMTPIVSIPNGPAWLLGMINLRSHLVPVFDLLMMCDLPSAEDEGRWILVLDKGERAVGMVVAEYPKRLIELRPASQLPTLPHALQRAVSAGYLAGSDLWLELDHRAFFAAFGSSAIDARP